MQTTLCLERLVAEAMNVHSEKNENLLTQKS